MKGEKLLKEKEYLWESFVATWPFIVHVGMCGLLVFCKLSESQQDHVTGEKGVQFYAT